MKCCREKKPAETHHFSQLEEDIDIRSNTKPENRSKGLVSFVRAYSIPHEPAKPVMQEMIVKDLFTWYILLPSNIDKKKITCNNTVCRDLL